MQTGHTRANRKKTISSVVFSEPDPNPRLLGIPDQSSFQNRRTPSPVKDSSEPLLFIPTTWELSRSSSSPPPPPSPLAQLKKPRMTSSIVDSVLEKCRRIDSDVQLASATYTQNGETLVRVRTGATGSVTMLRQAIETIMPLTCVDVIDSPLDGTCEISVVVPKKEVELRRARNVVRKRILPRVLGHVGFFGFLFGLAAWVIGIVEAAGVSDQREL